MIVFLSKPATQKDLQKAREEYQHYVKITIDVYKEEIIIGGEYHFEAEQALLDRGSLQEHIWGGGLDLRTWVIRTNAMINMRAGRNNSMEILDKKNKAQFLKIVLKYMYAHIKK